jgi:hypothetical protein
MEKEINKNKKAKWTLLLVGEQGDTKKAEWLKWVAIVTSFLLAFVGATAVRYYLVGQELIEENQRLKNELNSVRHQYSSAMNEKENLTARLLVAESKMEEEGIYTEENETPDENPNENNQENPENDNEEIQENDSGNKQENPATSEVEPPVENVDARSNVIAIENFTSRKSSSNRLYVRFNIRNIDPESNRVSGHIILVLKQNGSDRNKYLPLPRVDLMSGRPTGLQRGQTFSISRFKTVNFKTKRLGEPEKYKTATVFIFTFNGDLLLERDFNI